jgi:hypothetical protein
VAHDSVDAGATAGGVVAGGAAGTSVPAGPTG